jgi:hypothetical protein
MAALFPARPSAADFCAILSEESPSAIVVKIATKNFPSVKFALLPAAASHAHARTLFNLSVW